MHVATTGLKKVYLDTRPTIVKKKKKLDQQRSNELIKTVV